MMLWSQMYENSAFEYHDFPLLLNGITDDITHIQCRADFSHTLINHYHFYFI